MSDNMDMSFVQWLFSAFAGLYVFLVSVHIKDKKDIRGEIKDLRTELDKQEAKISAIGSSMITRKEADEHFNRLYQLNAMTLEKVTQSNADLIDRISKVSVSVAEVKTLLSRQKPERP